MLKCNVNATVFEGENKYGVGFCVEDDRGTFRCGKTMWFQGSPSPQVAEAICLVQGLQVLREKNFTSAIIEIDCFSVVNGVNHNVSLKTEFGILFSNCKTIIASQTNFVAHSLARASKSKSYASAHYHEFSVTCISNIVYL